MARVKRSVSGRKKKNKVMKQAKGYYGGKSKLYRTSMEAVLKSQSYAYEGRKQRKRDFRKLWIARINAATRMHDLSYSKFMHGLKLAGVDLNRKVLADMAVRDEKEFAKLVELVKNNL